MVQPPLLPVFLPEGIGEQLLGLLHPEEVLLIGRLLVGIRRRDHHGVDLQIVVEEVKDLAHCLRRVGVEERGVRRHSEAPRLGVANGGDRLIEHAVAVDGRIVALPQAVDTVSYTHLDVYKRQCYVGPHRQNRRGAECGPMRTSETRILTTHAGSLPRPMQLAELHNKRSRGEHVDARELRHSIEQATAASIAAQLTAGIDIGNDGEQARESFFTYVSHRMTGFGGTSERKLMADLLDHPDYLELAMPQRRRARVNLMKARAAIGRVAYRDTAEVDDACALVKSAGYLETFMKMCIRDRSRPDG